MIRYINMKSKTGSETIDELDRKDFKNYREFLKELRRLTSEYRINGFDCHTSQRPCAGWKDE